MEGGEFDCGKGGKKAKHHFDICHQFVTKKEK